MPRAWIETRELKSGKRAFRVKFRIGGSSSPKLYGGQFGKKREAEARRDWILGELAAMRVPEFELLRPPPVMTLRDVAHRWQASRVDLASNTVTQHAVNLSRILTRLGDRQVDRLLPSDVAGLVADLHGDGDGLARETIRKTIVTLALVLDFHGCFPNPARDKVAVKLPREEAELVTPPAAPHVTAVFRSLPREYRLPLLVLDATGMRVGELEGLRWGDVDEPDGRWLVRRSKTRRPRWVPVPDLILTAVADLVPREDRRLERQVFDGLTADAFRTAIGRACRAGAIPDFSPHDLRHRRATLWHLGGVPAAEASAWLGHSPVEHVKTYAHATLVDRSEVDYAALLVERARTMPSLQPPSFV